MCVGVAGVRGRQRVISKWSKTVYHFLFKVYWDFKIVETQFKTLEGNQLQRGGEGLSVNRSFFQIFDRVSTLFYIFYFGAFHHFLNVLLIFYHFQIPLGCGRAKGFEYLSFRNVLSICNPFLSNF